LNVAGRGACTAAVLLPISDYMPPYQEYAPFYDGSGQIRFAILISQYLREVLARHPVAGRCALDLACGTGTLALMLADQGWDVVGLDRSAAMLEQARSKATNMQTPGRVLFVQGDMRELRIEEQILKIENWTNPETSQFFSDFNFQFDLVTCVYDSLNYLLDQRELSACFEAVARYLAPGGLFVADMNTRYFLAHDWGTCEVIELPGFVQVAQSYFDAPSDCSTMVLTGFAGDDERGYTRFDETHVERAYAPEVIESALRAAEFDLEAVYDCFTFQQVSDHSQRIAWVARKPETRG
jgi:SAM-dependent methyltransferase